MVGFSNQNPRAVMSYLRVLFQIVNNNVSLLLCSRILGQAVPQKKSGRCVQLGGAFTAMAKNDEGVGSSRHVGIPNAVHVAAAEAGHVGIIGTTRIQKVIPGDRLRCCNTAAAQEHDQKHSQNTHDVSLSAAHPILKEVVVLLREAVALEMLFAFFTAAAVWLHQMMEVMG